MTTQSCSRCGGIVINQARHGEGWCIDLRVEESEMTEDADLTALERLERTFKCDGGYACCALVHVEGCYTGEGDPDAVKGIYVAALRREHQKARPCPEDPTPRLPEIEIDDDLGL